MFDIRLFELDRPEQDLLGLLDAEERERAGRFRLERDRRRFVARRGQLRALLGEQLGRSPAGIAFDHNACGKPAVRGGGDLRFSVASSGPLGLCVIAHGIDVGCDVERREPALADRATAERLFAPGERSALAAMPPEQWLEGFFNCWTRKEAFVKALGLGMSHPLDSFEVSLDAEAALLAPRRDCAMYAFEPAPGYHAAVVALIGEPQALVVTPAQAGVHGPRAVEVSAVP